MTVRVIVFHATKSEVQRPFRYEDMAGMVYYSLTSHSTQYRSFRRRGDMAGVEYAAW